MNTQHLIEKVRNLGVNLVPTGSDLKVELNGKKLPSGILAQLKQHKTRIINVLQSIGTGGNDSAVDNVSYDITLDELKVASGELWNELANDNNKLVNFIFTHKALTDGGNRYAGIPSGYCDDVSLAELEAVAGGDIEMLKNDKSLLLDFLIAYATAKKVQQRIVPDHYTQDVHCLNCGDVKLWEGCSEVVQGCPWCS